MKIVTDLFSSEIVIDTDIVSSVIIENPHVFMQLLTKIYNSVNGEEDGIILSDNNSIIKSSKYIELISSYVPFDINEKRLLNKINSLLEKEAINEVNYNDTMSILASIERFISKLSDLLPYIIDCSNINISSLIKMCGIAIYDDANSDIERIFNYMTLVRDLLGEKLFIFVNMHSFFMFSDIQLFIDTVIDHKFYVLLLDGNEYDKLENTRRFIIDKDLCII